jgi:anti-sigma B factor antagonist
MRINLRQVGDVTVLDLIGKFYVLVGDRAIRKAVQEVLERGIRNIILNLDEVSYLDSSCCAELVSAYSTVTKVGGKLRLLNLPPKIADILQITQLITFFDIYDDEQEALQSF